MYKENNLIKVSRMAVSIVNVKSSLYVITAKHFTSLNFNKPLSILIIFL